MKNDKLVTYFTIIISIGILLIGFAVAKVLIMDRESRETDSTSVSYTTTEINSESATTATEATQDASDLEDPLVNDE